TLVAAIGVATISDYGRWACGHGIGSGEAQAKQSSNSAWRASSFEPLRRTCLTDRNERLSFWPKNCWRQIPLQLATVRRSAYFDFCLVGGEGALRARVFRICAVCLRRSIRTTSGSEFRLLSSRRIVIGSSGFASSKTIRT